MINKNLALFIYIYKYTYNAVVCLFEYICKYYVISFITIVFI